MKSFLKNHYLAVIFALMVGIICIAPHIIFRISLGNDYRGVPIMQTANEDEYLFRMQELIDGHYAAGSPIFFEYKNQPPISPPVGEFFYVLPAAFFKTSLVNILTASRFFLPLILFLLVYFLIIKLTDRESIKAKINAIAGALLVTLGYDLVDYRRLFDFLLGRGDFAGDFLIWSRPVNPVLGAIFLFSFLLLVWLIIQNTKRLKLAIVSAAVFFALMMGSYFFSWGIALSIAAILILISLFKKNYKSAARLALAAILGFIFALPYWYSVWRASASPWYNESALRSGLFYTHYPLLNKLMLAVLVVYLIYIFAPIIIKRIKGEKNVIHFENWQWFCLALILGSFLAYNQQIVTGRTVWPYHFAQYTIPLALIVVMVLIYNILREKSRRFWLAVVIMAIISSFALGIYTQAATYAQFHKQYAGLQIQSALFDWLNRREKDCVVLGIGIEEGLANFDHAIPAFTHCNLYDSVWVFSLLPKDRIYHNYFVRLFLNGVTGQNIENYLAEHRDEARGRLFTNWKGLFNIKDFPDFNDGELEERLKRLPQDYREFLKKDFISELKKYRIDYIVIGENISSQARNIAANLKKVYDDGKFKVYEF